MLVSRGSRAAVITACAGLLLATSACGSDKTEEGATTTQVRLYGTDGNMQNSFIDEFKDRRELVNGMKGTTPLTLLPETFKDRLRTVDPQLKDYLYSAETYEFSMLPSVP